MNLAFKEAGLFLFIAMVSTYSFGTIQTQFFQYHHDNYFQLVGEGSVNFHDSGTNTFITPVANGQISVPPKCEEGEVFAWNADDLMPEENNEASPPSLPELRLRRGNQPVFPFFPLLNSIRGQFVRYVRRIPDTTSSSFSLIDGEWGANAWLERLPPDNYQLNGINHTPLSRIIYSLLSGYSVTQLQSQDVFDDIFYTPHDASIWLCIVEGTGKTKIKVHIVSGDHQFIAIFGLPPQLPPPRSRSLSPASMFFKYLSKKHQSPDGLPNSPLTQSYTSISSLTKDTSSSGQSTPPTDSLEILYENEPPGFTPYLAFFIICALPTQFQKYTW